MEGKNPFLGLWVPLILLSLFFVNKSENGKLQAAVLTAAPDTGTTWTFTNKNLHRRPYYFIVASLVKCDENILATCPLTSTPGAKIACPTGYDPHLQETDSGASPMLKAGWYCQKTGATSVEAGTFDTQQTGIMSYYINPPKEPATQPAETPVPAPILAPALEPASAPAAAPQIQRRISGIPISTKTKAFKDVTEKTKNYEEIQGLLTHMIEFGTFEMPYFQEFRSTKKTRGLLALQIALTVAKQPCEKRLRDTMSLACQRKAKELGLVAQYKHGAVTKAEFYELIIKAAKLEAPQEGEATICHDIAPTDPHYKTLSTLHKYGLLKLYKFKGESGQCIPDTPLPRRDAAILGWKALKL